MKLIALAATKNYASDVITVDFGLLSESAFVAILLGTKFCAQP